MPNQQQNSESKKKQANKVLKYSGMAFQMAITVFVFAFIGKKLDEYFGNEIAYLTALLALIGVTAALYLIIKDVSKDE